MTACAQRRLLHRHADSAQEVEPGPGLEITAVTVIDDDRTHITPVQQIVDTQEGTHLEPVQLDCVTAIQPHQGVRGSKYVIQVVDRDGGDVLTTDAGMPAHFRAPTKRSIRVVLGHPGQAIAGGYRRVCHRTGVTVQVLYASL